MLANSDAIARLTKHLSLNGIKTYFLYIFLCLQSPKFAPPIEFVDPAALSPPEGYKDGSGGGGAGGKLSSALGGALGGHVFGAQHMQQLQVIQRLQAQRAAMLAARATNGQQVQIQSQTSTGQQQQQTIDPSLTTVCSECAECAECAAKQMQGKQFFFIEHLNLIQIQLDGI